MQQRICHTCREALPLVFKRLANETAVRIDAQQFTRAWDMVMQRRQQAEAAATAERDAANTVNALTEARREQDQLIRSQERLLAVSVGLEPEEPAAPAEAATEQAAAAGAAAAERVTAASFPTDSAAWASAQLSSPG